MGIKLHICFDLGSDTLKIAYAYKRIEQGIINFGKIMFDEMINQSAIPATCYYDEDQAKWLFADQVEDGKVRSFVNTVKIKQLFSLVKRHRKEDVFAKNKTYYYESNLFPKFYFPIPLKIADKDDYQMRVDNKMVFEAPNWTPQKVCEAYFEYIYKVVMDKYKKLSDSKNIDFEGLELSLVYPPRSGMEYVEELKRVIKKTFKQSVGISMITTKALSLYAMHKRMVTANVPFLVFDMGESNISVTKAKLTNIRNTANLGIAVEGSDGHHEPIELGGNDLDDAILAFIEGQIKERETIGTASYGDENHIVESGVHSKQFMLMKNIKKGKMLLSKEPGKRNIFKDGVPISIHRDVRINRMLTKEQLLQISGVKGNKGVAKKIKDYILSELTLPINRDVKKVFLSGGLIETYGLFDFIVQEARKNSLISGVEFATFVANSSDTEMYPIKSYEDSTFAASIGGAIASIMKYPYDTCLSLSYGTWYIITHRESPNFGKKFLKLFDCSYEGNYEELERELKNTHNADAFKSSTNLAEKGNILPINGINFFARATIKSAVVNEELYSVNLTKYDMDSIMRGMRGSSIPHDSSHIFVGNDDRDPLRKRMMNECQLKVVAGGNKATINFYLDGVKVRITSIVSATNPEGRLSFFEGISMDCDGFAKPFIVNAEALNVGTYCNVVFMETKNGRNKDTNVNRVPASKIELRFEGVDSFGN